MPVYEFQGKQPRISHQAFIHPEAVIIGEATLAVRCFIAAG